MSDEDFIIKVSAPGAEQATRSVENLSAKLEELTEIMKNTGSGSKEFKTLKTEFDTISKAAREYSKVVSDINRTNSTAAISQQKLNSEMNKSAAQAAKLYTEQSKNALMQQKVTTEMSKNALMQQKVATEMNKTAMAASRLQMQQERAAAASAKMQAAAAKAMEPYNRMRTELKDYEAKLYNAIAAGKLNDTALAAMGTKYNRLKSELEGVNSKFKQVTNSIDESKMATIAFSSFLGNLAANAIQNLISSLGDMIGKISDAGVMLDGITNTFAAGARGWKQGGEEMAFVSETANRLGLNLQSTYEPYAKFMTSFTRSGGTLQESRQIFEDLSEAMVALHLNSSQMENIFVALEQMANKGTVQAEELKRQLGNALPGAFELAAQSMGVTTAELMDMMKAGEVVSREFLPKFAALVKDSLGKQVGIAVNQYNANLNRMQSQTFLLQANLGQLWNSAIMPLVAGTSSLLKVVNMGTGAIKESAAATTLLQTALVATGTAAVLFVKQFGIVNTSLAVMRTNALAAGKALLGLVTSPVGATLLTIGAAALYCANAINNTNKKYAEMAVQQRDVANNMTGLISEYAQLAEITNKSEAQQEAYKRVLSTLSEEYPTVLEYIATHEINLKNLTQAQADNIASMAVQQKMQEAEQLMMDELSDKWSIFGTRVKQNAAIALLGLQTIGTGILHVVITVEQACTRLVSIYAKTVGEVTEKAAFVTSKIGAKELAVKFDNATKALKGFANSTWEVGKGQREYLNEGLKQTAYWIQNMEFERKEKAMKTYKDTVVELGKEQTRLAQQLMYSSTALSDVATGKEGKKSKSGSKTVKTKKADSAWDELNKEVSALEELIKVRELNGQSIDDIAPKYVRSKKLQDDINKSVQRLDEIPKTGLDLLKQKAKDAADAYEKMIGNSTAFTRQEINEAAALMKRANAEVTYYDVLKKREGILQISRREAGKMVDTMLDSIFEPLDESETLWERFKDAGLSAIKAIATGWTKNVVNSMLAGFSTNWLNNANLPFTQRIGAAARGAITGAAGIPLQGYKDAQINAATGWLSGIGNAFKTLWGKVSGGGSTTGGAAPIGGASNLLSGLINQATTLTNVLMGQTNSAVDAANSAISAISNPAMQAAGSIANMAASAPIAAVGMMGMSASMTALAPAATSAAPALMQMGAALGTIATNATMAATSMAALAVATAAESVAKIPFVGGFLAPAAALATGAAIGAGAGQMLGGAMTGVGNKLGCFGASKSTSASIIPHAKGGIVSSPTTFPMQGGNIGLAGEAGTEVIAPAKRMSNGDIGVGAVQPQVIVNNYTNAAVEVKKRPDNSTEIKIAELNAMLSSSRTNTGMSAAQSRMQKKGRQIG